MGIKPIKSEKDIVKDSEALEVILMHYLLQLQQGERSGISGRCY